MNLGQNNLMQNNLMQNNLWQIDLRQTARSAGGQPAMSEPVGDGGSPATEQSDEHAAVKMTNNASKYMFCIIFCHLETFCEK